MMSIGATGGWAMTTQPYQLSQCSFPVIQDRMKAPDGMKFSWSCRFLSRF
jgi:hypothetical protein